MEPIYLDNAATTPVAPEVREAMLPFLGERFGNPSSRHPVGVSAADAVAEARRQVAAATGARPEDVFFASGGTEANNLAVLGLARAARRKGRHVLIGPTEHPSVRDAALALRDEGFEVESSPPGAGGELDLDALVALLRPETVLVAQMFVNNEFGSVYPVARVARLVHANAPNARLHVDAVQAIGKLGLSLGETGADSLSISAHKIHGPKGSGALVLREGVRPRPLVFGGSQEGGIRSGTENVAGIVGLGCAARLAATRLVEARARLTELRELMRSELAAVSAARPIDPGGEASPAILALRLPGPPAEVWMHHLEARGVMTSAGSACQAKKAGISPALLALGLNEDEARRILRVSFSRATTTDEVRRAAGVFAEVERELGAAAR